MAQDTFFRKRRSINCGGNLLFLDEPIIMGILNATPDSFFDGGKFNSIENALLRAEQIIAEGGKIVDIGGYSSRPGATNISEEEEINRVTPIVKAIANQFSNIVISIDTFRAKVAEAAIGCGAHIINDISGGNADSNMFTIVSKLQVPYILMHMQGTPQNMQQNPQYDNIVEDLILYFSKKIKLLTNLGVNDIVIDPGFGFGKTMEHNYEILEKLEYFNVLQQPILAGLSRKSMIYKKLGITPKESLPETCRLNKIAIQKGATILRVHDVKEAVQLTVN